MLAPYRLEMMLAFGLRGTLLKGIQIAYSFYSRACLIAMPIIQALEIMFQAMELSLLQLLNNTSLKQSSSGSDGIP
jgi:hypothetical protein